jgi:O-antigen/teichoic acid export membrane protein
MAGSVLSGTASLVLSRYVVAVLGWAGTVVIVRQLSPSDWGGFSFIFSLLGVVGFFSDLQVSRIVLQSILASERDAARTVSSYLTLRLLLGMVVYAVAVGIVVAGDYPPEVVRGTAVAASTLVLASGAAALRIFFEARVRLHPLAVVLVVGQLAQLLLTLVIAGTGEGTLVSFMIPALLFDLVVFALSLLVARRSVRIRLVFDPRAWWEWIREAVPLSLGAALAVVYFRIDMIMLSKLDTLESVGQYSIGYKFSDLVGFLPHALLAPTLTLLIRAWPDDAAPFQRVFRHSLVLLTIVAVGVAVIFAAVAQPAIVLFYGSHYAEVDWAARWLVAAQALNFFTKLAFVTLLAVGRRGIFPVAYLLGLVINVGLNLVLIPRYSYNGAAVATVLTELVVLGILGGAVLRLPAVHPLPLRGIVRIAVAAAAAAMVLFGLNGLLPWLLVAVIGGATYLGALHLLKVDGPGGLRAIIRNAPRVPAEAAKQP